MLHPRQISLKHLLIWANVLGIVLAIGVTLLTFSDSQLDALRIALMLFVLLSGLFGFIGTMISVLFLVSICITPDQNEDEKRKNIFATGKILSFSVLFAIFAPAVLIIFSITVISFTS